MPENQPFVEVIREIDDLSVVLSEHDPLRGYVYADLDAAAGAERILNPGKPWRQFLGRALKWTGDQLAKNGPYVVGFSYVGYIDPGYHNYYAHKYGADHSEDVF